MTASEAHALIERWRAYLATEDNLSDREADAISTDLTSATGALLAEGGEGRRVLLDAYASGDGMAAAIGTALLPPPARAVLEPGAFRAHPEVALTAAQLPLASSLSLPVAEEMVDHDGFRGDPLAWTGSWFAGRPAVAKAEEATTRWPTRSDGRPLTHLLQVDLAAESANQGFEEYASTGLPEDGVLQVFHDLETYGDEDGADPSAWTVRWLTTFMPDDLTLAVPPSGVEVLGPLPINAQVNLTAPELDQEARGRWAASDLARYDRARDWLELSAAEANMMATGPGTDLTPWHEDYVAPPEVSRVGGHPFTATTPRIRALLARRLPLTTGDRHLLLVDLNPLQLDAHLPASEHWFHGGRHLEVWIRASDLAARNLQESWAFIRMD